MKKKKQTRQRKHARKSADRVFPRKTVTPTLAAQMTLRKCRKSKKPRIMSQAMKEKLITGPENVPAGAGKGADKTVWREVKKLLADKEERAAVAKAFVGQMKKGNFAFHKEVIDREEGKVPNRFANADGQAIKTYAIGLPVEGKDAP